MSTTELGSEVVVQQKTACLFQRKISAAIKQNNKNKLKGTVDDDKTRVGGYNHKKREV